MKTLMSKISICCLVLCMLLACTVPAFAEDSYAKPTLQVVSATAKPGETVDVAIVMYENPGIICMRLVVDYDSDVLTLTKVTDGGILGSTMHSNNLEDSSYTLCWANDFADKDFEDDGQLVLLTFAVKEDAELKEYPIAIENGYEIYNYDFDDIHFDLVAGSVTVKGACSHVNKTETPAKEAGCETTGNNLYYTCNDCGVVLKADGTTETIVADETLHVLGHDMADATCTEAAKCKRDGCVYTEGDALGHSFVNYVYDDNATCTVDGTKTAECDNCPETDTVADDAHPALGHSYNSVVTAPTCTEKGYTTYTCSVCGDEYVDDYTESTGHNYVGEETTAPSCTEAGEMTYTCTGCSDSYTEEIKALGHNMQKTADEVAATCEGTGKTAVYTCANGCGKTEGGEEIKALGHTAGTAVVENKKPATVNAAGSYDSVVYCSVCNKELSRVEMEIPVLDGKVETEEYQDSMIPESIKDTYDTAEKLEEHMLDAIAAKYEEKLESINLGAEDLISELIDVALKYSEDGGKTWQKADETHFPADGKLEILLPVPEGTMHSRFTYFVAHMFTSDAFGKVIGELEYPEVEEITKDGKEYIRFYVTGLSPVNISYAETDPCADGHVGPYTYTANTDGETHKVICDRCEQLVEAEETHTEVIDAAEEADCTNPGKTQGKHCSVCGEILVAQETVEAKGHTEVIDAAEEADCTNPGKTQGKHCSVCGEILVAQETIEAKGHTEVIDAAVEADCTNPGKTQGKHCTVCGEILVAQETVEAKGHTEVIDAAVEAGCTNSGKTQGKHCSVCGEILVAQETIEAKGHNEVVDPEVKPTCVAEGKTEGKHCDRCDTILEPQETVAPLGHTEVIDEAVDATCKATGLTEGKHCSVCGEILVAQIVTDKLPHTEEIVPAFPATCTTPGKTEGVKCSVCGEVLTAQEETDALGHTEEIVPAVPATCTTTGLTEGVKCSVCNTTLTAQEVIEALGHTEETLAGYPATCTEDGLTDGKKCSVCGTVTVEQTVIPAAGHAWVGGVCTECTMECEHSYDIESGECTICGGDCDHEYATVVTPPSCTAQGYTTNTCSICGNSFKNNFQDALGHTMQEATCTAPKTCSTCGATEGEANGHNYVAVVTPPSCTAQGYTTYTCAACGDSYKSDYQDALGHTEAAPVEENRVEPGCTEAGHYDKVVYCSVCGTELSKEPVTIPATGHNYDAVVTNPTCADQGYTTYTCTNCGDNYKSDYENALGHTEVIDEAKDATCTEGGLTEGKHCSVCEKVLVEQSATSPLGHTEGEAKTEDCHNDLRGCVYDTVSRCSDCGNVITRKHMFLMGDVNLDGKVSLSDATMIYEKYILKLSGLNDFNDIQKLLGNVNLRGELTLADATQVYEYVLKVLNNTLEETDWEPYLASIEVE